MRAPILLAGCLAAAGLAVPAAPAAAQASPCGPRYEVQRGDTLYGIAQQCRVALARIMDLNPSLGDPRDIAVGTGLRLQAAASGSGGEADPAGRTGEGYRVQEGDTLFSIAQAAGVSLFELMNANESADPFDLAVGELLEVPGDEPGASVSLAPRSGPPASDVTLEARNLRPHDWVTVGVGPMASEWRPLRSVQVADDGTLTADVAVPDWADAGDSLIYVVDTDRGMTFKSGSFAVTGGGGGGGGGGLVSLEGRVREGTECYRLETPDGDVWSLVGETFEAGTYVQLEGRRADMSFCMEGIGTIEVTAIEEVEPPARDLDPDRAGGVTLDEAYLAGPWTAKGGDCRRPDFDISRNSAGGLVVETSLNGSPRTGYVALGQQPAFVFDRPHRELQLESRGPDGLAVMPPAQGGLDLGGAWVAGDGRVFVACG